MGWMGLFRRQRQRLLVAWLVAFLGLLACAVHAREVQLRAAADENLPSNADEAADVGAADEEQPEKLQREHDIAQASNAAKERLEQFRARADTIKTVRILPIEGTIELGLVAFLERALENAPSDAAIVLAVKTFGGRVDAAVRIRDAILDSRAATIAYVDRRAISAGALISLGADILVMSPGASIGAATPVQQGAEGKMEATGEKVVSYMRAEMRSTAEAKGRPGDLAEAMVDRDFSIEGVSEKGKLLTLTDTRAVELGLADASYPTIETALAELGLGEAPVTRFEVNWAERIARFFTDPTVSSLLMSLGFIGLLMELYSPGFGVGGLIGITCLALFFGGHFIARLAGWEEIGLLAVGLGLLALELFVVPGFGIVGILGILAILGSLFMVLIHVELPWSVASELGYLREAISRAVIQLAIVMVTVTGVGFWMAKKLPESRLTSWLVFKPTPETPGSSAGLGAEAHGGSLPERSDLIGKRGKTKTVLRPAGIVEIDHERLDVVAEGEFIDPGETVEVTQVQGFRIVVRRA